MSDNQNAKPKEALGEKPPIPEFHVTWESPVFGLSGYAASSRAALRGLEEAGARLRLLPMEHEKRETLES